MDFNDFFPSWRNTSFWEQWKKYARMCFGTGLTYVFPIYHHLMNFPDDDRKAVKDRSKTIKTPIEIVTDVDGEPEIPIIDGDAHGAKAVQDTLRNYLISHIREFYLSTFAGLQDCFTYVLGFTSGKKKAIIPWTKLISNPTAWIDENCYPSGFKWADPSKLHKEQVIDLLGHWRQRQKSGLAPLIWNPSCSLLADAAQTSRRVQSRNDPESDHDSGEENFASRLGNISENDPESDHSQCRSRSPFPPQTGPGSPESDEAQDTGLVSPALPAQRHHSCKSKLSIYLLSPT
jgi:hypothetical protein